MKASEIKPGGWYILHNGAQWRDHELFWLPADAAQDNIHVPAGSWSGARHQRSDHGVKQWAWREPRRPIPRAVAVFMKECGEWELSSILPRAAGRSDYVRHLYRRDGDGWEPDGYTSHSRNFSKLVAVSDADLLEWVKGEDARLKSLRARDEQLRQERADLLARQEAARDRLPKELVDAIGIRPGTRTDWVKIEELWNHEVRTGAMIPTADGPAKIVETFGPDPQGFTAYMVP